MPTVRAEGDAAAGGGTAGGGAAGGGRSAAVDGGRRSVRRPTGGAGAAASFAMAMALAGPGTVTPSAAADVSGDGAIAGNGARAAVASAAIVPSAAMTDADADESGGESRRSVFAPEPGQEYELAFFIAAALLTVLVAGGFIAVIVLHGRGSRPADREAEPHEVEA